MDIFSNDSVSKALFNAIPAIALIVDSDVRIIHSNETASKLLNRQGKAALPLRGGEALHCIHAGEVSEGCGRAPGCKACGIRNSVTEAFRGNSIVRSRARIELIRDDKIEEVFALITASPLLCDGVRFVLLVIEDITEMVALQKIIPICMSCKKVRNDEQYWTELAEYFNTHLDLEFSHGYCPDCAEKEFEKLKNTIDEF